MTDTHSDKEEKTKSMVGSLVHGLNIIMAFDRNNPQMTLSQVAEKTGMDRAGARRYLLTLVGLGFVEQNARLFRLTPKVMDLGYAYLSSVPLSEKAQHYLEKIRDKSGFPVALGIVDGLHIVHVASANTDELMSPALTIGRRFPIAYASAGRAILSAMEDAKREQILAQVTLEPMTDASIRTIEALRGELKSAGEKGYALVDQEMQMGVRSLAVPILNVNGTVVGSFNTFTFTSLVSKEQLITELLPVLQEAAQDLQRMLT